MIFSSIFDISFTKEDNLNTVYQLINSSKEYAENGDFINAKNQLDKALVSSNFSNPLIYSELGQLNFQFVHINESIESYKKALIFDNTSDFIYSELGWSYFEVDSFNQAYDMFNNALNLNDNNDLAIVGLQAYYLEKNDLINALYYFNKSIKVNPKNALAYYELGK